MNFHSSGRNPASSIRLPRRDNLIERVLKTIRNYEMVKPGDRVMAAVSGGPDSVFLLHALIALKNKLKLTKVTACHLDHGLRGHDAALDAEFVKRIASAASVEYYHGKVGLAGVKSKKLSPEELARETRYAFYGECVRRSGITTVATGHTLDDQAETVLMRIVKGASLKGAAGILPVRRGEGVKFIRPMLEIEKAEIIKYLDGEGIEYCIDRTNLENIYFRNVVRNEILPFLAKYNPRIKRSLFNFAGHLREDFEFIENHRKAVAPGMICSGKNLEVSIGLKDIVVQPKALQKEILRDALEKAGGEVKRLSFRHWKDLESFIRDKRTGDSIDLPGDIRITRTNQSLIFAPRVKK